MALIDTRLVTLWRLLVRPIIKSSNFRWQLPGRKNGRKFVKAITAESIYRCMLLFLDHILYHRAHFVRNALHASRAVLAISEPQTQILSCQLPVITSHFVPMISCPIQFIMFILSFAVSLNIIYPPWLMLKCILHTVQPHCHFSSPSHTFSWIRNCNLCYSLF